MGGNCPWGNLDGGGMPCRGAMGKLWTYDFFLLSVQSGVHGFAQNVAVAVQFSSLAYTGLGLQVELLLSSTAQHLVLNVRQLRDLDTRLQHAHSMHHPHQITCTKLTGLISNAILTAKGST